jgi:hypothetical protein
MNEIELRSAVDRRLRAIFQGLKTAGKSDEKALKGALLRIRFELADAADESERLLREQISSGVELKPTTVARISPEDALAAFRSLGKL